jgi:uncharacterized protein (UPF0276 family)
VLGVGIMLSPALRGLLQSDPGIVDYVAVIPDTLWVDHGRGESTRYTHIDESVRFLDWLSERQPIVGHSIGLSIASADLFDKEHVAEIARWQSRYAFPWHSDHLSYSRLRAAQGGDRHTALPLPPPYDAEVLQLVSERVEVVQAQVHAPFLLENNVFYVDIPAQEMSEPEFLNALTARTGCGLLLDVHNLYTNAQNHGLDPHAFLDELDTDSIVEVHVAGGEEFAGMYTDAHSGACPEQVWQLLDRVLAEAPHVGGVTFELEPSYYARLREAGVREQLSRARAIWDRHH